MGTLSKMKAKEDKLRLPQSRLHDVCSYGSLEHNPPGKQPLWNTTAPEPITPDRNPPGNKTSLRQNHPLEQKPLEHITPGTQPPGTHNLYGPTHGRVCRIQRVSIARTFGVFKFVCLLICIHLVNSESWSVLAGIAIADFG